jgi:hypothetical protein
MKRTRDLSCTPPWPASASATQRAPPSSSSTSRARRCSTCSSASRPRRGSCPRAKSVRASARCAPRAGADRARPRSPDRLPAQAARARPGAPAREPRHPRGRPAHRQLVRGRCACSRSCSGEASPVGSRARSRIKDGIRRRRACTDGLWRADPSGAISGGQAAHASG